MDHLRRLIDDNDASDFFQVSEKLSKIRKDEKKKLIEKTSYGWEFTNKISDLNPNEEAFVTLTRLSPLEEEDFDAVMQHRERIITALKATGYTYVTLDLQGLRMGSMNEVLANRA